MAAAEETTSSISRLIIIGLLAVLVCLGGFAVYLFSSLDNAAEPVILRADADPYKVRPADPGGKKLDNLDSPMMGLLGGNESAEPGTELLLPPEEEPELPPISVEVPAVAETPEPAAPESISEGEEPVATAATQPPAGEALEAEPEPAVTAAAEAASSPAAETAAAPEQEPPAVTEAETKAETVAKTVTETSAEPAPEAPVEAETAAVDSIDAAVDQVIKPEPKPRIKPVLPTGDNTFLVQFAAFRSEKSARETAALLTTKHAGRLDGMVLGYMRKGEYWRVVSDPLPRGDAASMCRVFVSVGQDCIVKSLD